MNAKHGQRVVCRAAWWVGVLLAVLAPGLAAQAIAQPCGPSWSPGYGLPGVSGSINAAVELPGGDVVAAGNFTTAGKVAARAVARCVHATGEWSAMGGGLDGLPSSATVTSDGQVVVATNVFNATLGYNVGYVFKWDGAAWQQVGGMFDHPIYALAALPNGEVVAGGEFMSPGARVARWDVEAAQWQQLPSGGPQATVNALALTPDGDLLAAWSLASQGAVVRLHAGAWTQVGGLASGGGINGLAAEASGEIIAVGTFTALDGSANRVAHWNGSAWTAMGSGTDYNVYCVCVLPGGDVMIGGEFGTAGGLDTARRLARWNGSAWSSVVPAGSQQVVGSVKALATTQSGDVLAAGGFSSIGNAGVSNIARMSGATGAWEPVSKGWNAAVNTLYKLAGGDVLVGGGFSASGETSAFAVGRWSPLTGTVTPMGSLGSFAAIPNTFCELANGDIYVGGTMSLDTGGIGNGLVRWNGSAWVSVGTGTAGGSFNTVYSSLRLSNGDMVIGGMFTSVNGVSTPLIARWNGSAWSSIGGGLSGASGASVFALAELPGGDLVAAGRFTSAGGVPVTNIARWNCSAWSALGTGLTPASVTALAVLPGGDLLAGGAFTTADGSAASHLARWNGSAWSAFGGGVSGGTVRVNAISVLPGGDVVVGGSFTTAGGATIRNLARWDGAAWNGYGAGIEGGAVNGLAQVSGGGLLAGGGFDHVDGQVSRSLAEWTPGVDRCGLADLGAQGGVATACGDGQLDNNDFIAFISLFFAHDPLADLGVQGGLPGSDGQFDNNDFIAFISLFFGGC